MKLPPYRMLCAMLMAIRFRLNRCAWSAPEVTLLMWFQTPTQKPTN